MTLLEALLGVSTVLAGMVKLFTGDTTSAVALFGIAATMLSLLDARLTRIEKEKDRKQALRARRRGQIPPLDLEGDELQDTAT